MFCTYARSILIAARDLAHALNISPANSDREKRVTNDAIVQVMTTWCIYISSYSLRQTTDDVNVVFFGEIFLYIRVTEEYEHHNACLAA